MLEKILYPTDFSDVAQKVLPYIIKLSGSGNKEVVVLHVIDNRRLDSVCRRIGVEKFEALYTSIEEEARQSLQKLADKLAKSGLKTKLRIEAGTPVREILRVAKEENVSAIVIGSHGVSNMREIFLGSISEKVIRRSEQPVLVIKR